MTDQKRFIHWTPEELDSAITKAHQLMLEGRFKILSSAIMEAQCIVLPYFRQKPKSSVMSSGKIFNKRYEELQHLWKREEDIKALKEQKLEEQAVEETKVEEERISEIADLVSEDNEIVETTEVIDSVISDAISRIASLFKQTLLAEIAAVTREVMIESVASVEKQISTLKPDVERRTKPRIVVAGFKPGQQGDIVRMFNNKLNLTFIEERLSPVRLKNSAEYADYVVLNTEYTSHAYLEVVKNHKGLIRVEGFQKLKEKLSELSNK